MSGSVFQLTVQGARGSMAGDREDCAVFGGDTSCYMLEAGDETIFLDAGTGLLRAPAYYPKPPLILLSHLHLDHVIGLGMFPGITNRNQRPSVYIPFCESRSAAEKTMDRLFSPPFWPLTLQDCESTPALLPMPAALELGEVTVAAMPGNHPGGCLVFRIEYRGKCVVYATDFEHEETSFARLTDFAHGADLLLYDAQYTQREYELHRGYGHSTAEKGLELMERSGAKRLLLVHHAPWSTDRDLILREEKLPKEKACYARQGQRIILQDGETDKGARE